MHWNPQSISFEGKGPAAKGTARLGGEGGACSWRGVPGGVGRKPRRIRGVGLSFSFGCHVARKHSVDPAVAQTFRCLDCYPCLQYLAEISTNAG